MGKRWAAVLVSVFCVAVFLVSHAEAAILINEVLADPPAVGGDANGDGVISATQDEFVELVNTGANSVSVSGWTLSDLVSVRHTFSASSTIPSLGFFVVFGGGSPQGFSNVAVASTGTLSLNNAGDTVSLRDAQGQLIDSLAYGAEGGKDVSLTRVPDAVGSFVLHTIVNGHSFSPGKSVDGQPSLARLRSSETDPPGSPTIPEPASLLLLSGGLTALVCVPRRCRRVCS